MTAPARDRVTVRCDGAALSFDPAVGNLRRLDLRDGDRILSPLHTAPWVDRDDADLPDDLAPVERQLSGDFLCAPFAQSDVEPAPPHGWSANSHWTVTDQGARHILARLDRPVMGARIDKRLTLSAQAPILIQEHRVDGGHGGLPLAHHPMVRLGGPARFCCSPKRIALGPDAPLDPGRNRLATGARTRDLTRFPGAEGGSVDLTRLPIAEAHEDFVTLVEAQGNPLGWTALLREDADDIVFFVKDPKVLPVTMLWHSNGGRDHAPWNGQHRGVIGIEDGCAAGAAGHRAALGPNPVAATGVPTCLPLGPGTTHRIVHLTGAIARPAGWSAVTDIRLSGTRLTLIGDSGGTRSLDVPEGLFDTTG
ncbi:MAG: hypothetical protein HLUCCA08_15315 [Rhodobacteraceae bacterium HLUCCA08]|nr:MAG: hypothetical protein HLUCCA08_15315 [Rhodobacteraceae bacterium HLUCCA08]